MGSKLHFALFICLLSFAVAALLACEDNPEECFDQDDCEEGYVCEATYYNSGNRSGGICVKTETEEDGGESDETEGAPDAAVQDSSQPSTIVDANAEAATAIDAAGDAQEAAVPGDAAPDAPETGAEAAVEGGQPPPAEGGIIDSGM